MVRTFKLHKMAGPSGTFAGYLLLIFGVITSFFVLSGIPVLIIGLYLSFGYFCSTVDADNRRVRSGIMLFGWAISGKWILIDDSYITEFRQIKTKHTVYSSSNRSLDLNQIVYQISLVSNSTSKKFVVAVFQDKQEADENVKIIEDLLRIKKPE
jgi:hypothetical protein